MDKERFEAIIAAYGADPRRWPEGEREAARAFAASAQADLREARLVDALLDAAPTPAAASDLLQARILRTARSRRLPAAAPGMALAACALLGVVLGYGAGRTAPEAAEVDELLAATFETQGFPAGEDS